jgi:hypothetical protein
MSYEYVVKTWVYETDTKSIEYNGLYETETGVKTWDNETEATEHYDDAIFNGQYISVMLIKIDPDSNENRETIISEWEESLSEYEDPDGDEEEEEWFDIVVPVKKNIKKLEDNENKLMIELRALLDKRYVIKQERYNNWSNAITIYAEFDCAVYSKKPNHKYAGYWNCGKCDCHYPCGTSKAFEDLIYKYGYRHDVIDCSCVSGLWKIK